MFITIIGSSSILSFVWHWYVTNFAHPNVKDHVLSFIHGSFLALPWHNFRPSIVDLELMFKVLFLIFKRFYFIKLS